MGLRMLKAAKAEGKNIDQYFCVNDDKEEKNGRSDVPAAADLTLLKDTGDSELFLAGMRRTPLVPSRFPITPGLTPDFDISESVAAVRNGALARDFFRWLNSGGSRKAVSPVELAGAAHFRFANRHPFGDGNCRTPRLLMNYILIKNGYPPLNIRSADRYQYYRVLEKGNLQYDEMHFLKWFVKYYMKRNGQYGGSARQHA